MKESFEFALMVIKYAELLDEKRKYIIAKQLVRSGTSVGANIKEAQNAESKADFVHKLKVSLKEADETEYWLFLCENLENYPNPEGLIDKLNGIIKMLNKIISTTKNNIRT
ncbi:four helix bundle protein [Flavobacterium sp.]|uniref:four helix bundle protein n=1 Tax=Flavobacterium sp. TaxID=239 RepID=UPI0037C11A16